LAGGVIDFLFFSDETGESWVFFRKFAPFPNASENPPFSGSAFSAKQTLVSPVFSSVIFSSYSKESLSSFSDNLLDSFPASQRLSTYSSLKSVRR